MSAAWAKLAESGWAANNAKRGFKVIQIYRSDCAETPRVELRISAQDGKDVQFLSGD